MESEFGQQFDQSSNLLGALVGGLFSQAVLSIADLYMDAARQMEMEVHQRESESALFELGFETGKLQAARTSSRKPWERFSLRR